MKLEERSALEEIYANNIQFEDPIHEINGLKNLKQYFNKLDKNLIDGSFEFADETVAGDKAFLSWKMVLNLKKPQKKVSASGFSVLIIKDKIVYQRDYFDAGELFYEHIPVLGKLIKLVKKQIAK
ncbi:MAG: nuclear transport factor 2 family protein [Bacteroidetes bacterium]|nr:nuclear transport factor 2 family protein [Bacteroidota bacterium]